MDFTQIQALLGVAASAAGFTKDAASTVAEVKKVFAADKGSASGETQGLLSSLAEQLTAANMTNAKLSTLLVELGKTLQAESDFDERRRRYRLVDNGHGEMLWELRSEAAEGEPPHYICPICIEKTRQFHYVTGSPSAEGKYCQSCRHFFRFRPKSPVRLSGLY